MEVSGILLIDKPRGMSSHDVVYILRKKLNIKKIGHAGTLDPEATGLLIMLIGRATKLSSSFLNCDKTYDVELTLGIKTSTGDVAGQIVKEATIPVLSADDIERNICSFCGKSEQVPPMYSAKKVRGQKLYNLARKGIDIPRQPQMIFIEKIKINRIDLPRVNFTVKCSKGTYIRVLCEDIGKKLTTCAFMSSLRRIACGDYSVSQAFKAECIKTTDRGFILKKIINCGQI